jgi:hypothetical protein
MRKKISNPKIRYQNTPTIIRYNRDVHLARFLRYLASSSMVEQIILSKPMIPVRHDQMNVPNRDRRVVAVYCFG